MRITQGLVRAVVTAANRTATIDGDRRRTWREVGDRVARLAGGLREQAGLATGDPESAAIVCFTVAQGWRGQGMATKLLEAALKDLAAQGVYPDHQSRKLCWHSPDSSF